MINASDTERASAKKRLQNLISFSSEDGASAINSVFADATFVRLLPRRFVFRSGDDCDVFLILLSGAIRVQLNSSRGREVTLYRITPGISCVLTTSCLLNGDVYPAEAVVESAIEALAISQEDFYKVLECSPGFRQFAFKGFSVNLGKIIAKVEQLAFTSIDSRLSRALLDLHEKGENRITHQELACELGTAREVVSRRLKHFESAGWIELSRGRINVSDRNELQILGSQIAL